MKNLFRKIATRRLHKWLVKSVALKKCDTVVWNEVSKFYGHLVKGEPYPERLSIQARKICKRAGFWLV